MRDAAAGPARLPPRPALAPLLLLAACSVRSEVAELAPGLYGLTHRGPTLAAAARIGVEEARAHCTSLGAAGFEPVRTAFSPSEYQIAFRCPRQAPGPVAQDPPPAPGFLNPFLEP